MGANICPDERPFVRPLVSPDDCRSLRLTNVDSSGRCNPNEKRTKKSVRSRAPDFRRSCPREEMACGGRLRRYCTVLYARRSVATVIHATFLVSHFPGLSTGYYTHPHVCRRTSCLFQCELRQYLLQSRRAPAPSTTSMRRMRGLLLAPRGWERVKTGWGGGRRPPRSPRWSTVPRTRSARRRWRKGDCTGLPWWPPCGVGEKGVEILHGGPVGVARQW